MGLLPYSYCLSGVLVSFLCLPCRPVIIQECLGALVAKSRRTLSYVLEHFSASIANTNISACRASFASVTSIT